MCIQESGIGAYDSVDFEKWFWEIHESIVTKRADRLEVKGLLSLFLTDAIASLGYCAVKNKDGIPEIRRIDTLRGLEKPDRHCHADMIIQKVNDMDLVVFCYSPAKQKYHELAKNFLPDSVSMNYFMCLPKYRKECLCWLNSGRVQIESPDGKWVDVDVLAKGVLPSVAEHNTWLMTGQSFRIKPRPSRLDYAAMDLYKLLGRVVEWDKAEESDRRDMITLAKALNFEGCNYG